MARFNITTLLYDKSSVESVTPSKSSCSCSHNYSTSSDEFVTEDKKRSSIDELVIAFYELNIEDSALGDVVDDESINQVDVHSTPPVATVVIDIHHPPQRSSRLRRKPMRFADEYTKYYAANKSNNNEVDVHSPPIAIDIIHR